MRRIAVVIVAAAGTLVASAPAAWSCTCVRRSDRQHWDASAVIFSGVAASMTDPKAGAPVFGSGDPVTWTFRVEEVQKGAIAADTYRVRTARYGASCGVAFEVGERYQVFVPPGPAVGMPDDGVATTNLCSGTRVLAADGVPYEPDPPASFVIIAVLGALALAWSVRRVRRTAPPTPGPEGLDPLA